MHVVVIGAGVIGAAVADALAGRGCDVTVLDMRGPGRGASQASAGILAPYTEAHRGSPLLALGARSLDMYDRFVDDVRERSGRPVEYARTGTLEVALDEAGAERLAGEVGWLQAEGVDARWLDASGVREAAPAVAPGALGGLWIAPHGFVSVPALVEALTVSARDAGAAFQMPAEVARVEATSSGPRVRAVDRDWTADVVVLAGGAWSGRVRVEGAPAVPVRPVRGQLLHLDWREGDPPGQVVWGPDCYTVPWSDRSLLVGATVEEVDFDESSTVEGVRGLTDAVARLLPAARTAALKAVRVGLRPAMPDGMPAIGWLAPNVAVAAGHYRNGILLAPLTADVITRLVVDGDRDPAIALTDPRR